MNYLDQVRPALRRVLKAHVETLPLEEWQSSLREGGWPTRLRKPLGPYLGIQEIPGFELAVVSGAPYAEEPGFHFVRRDERDAARGGLFKTYSTVVLVDLTAHPRWPEVLRRSGLEETGELVALIRTRAFSYIRPRPDHWNDTIPKDIASAIPKEDES